MHHGAEGAKMSSFSGEKRSKFLMNQQYQPTKNKYADPEHQHYSKSN